MQVHAEPDTAAEGIRRKDDAGLLVLGRLLLVALGAGALIGGLTAQLLVGWTGPYAATVSVVGACVGMPLALAVQSLNAVALHWTRSLRPGISRAGMRAMLVPLPTLAAIASSAGFASPDAASGLLVYVVPAVSSAISAWVAAPWCLAPILPRTGHGRD